LRRGWRIPYEPEAIAYTETPGTLLGFLNQRFRWIYGTMQCFWKHVDLIFKRPSSPMSYLLLPNILIFGIILPLSYPIVDVVLVAGLFFGVWQELLLPALIFTGVDMLYALWGLRGEGSRRSLVWVVPLLRIAYRQLLYYTVVRVLVRAIEGGGVGWNKVARMGDTKRFFDEHLASLPKYTRGGDGVAPRAAGHLLLRHEAPAGGSNIPHP
jgi:peptidoglycan-N-acetylglucosamine deacetylase